AREKNDFRCIAVSPKQALRLSSHPSIRGEDLMFDDRIRDDEYNHRFNDRPQAFDPLSQGEETLRSFERIDLIEIRLKRVVRKDRSDLSKTPDNSYEKSR